MTLENVRAELDAQRRKLAADLQVARRRQQSDQAIADRLDALDRELAEIDEFRAWKAAREPSR